MLWTPLLLHGAMGWWDEILCLIPSALLIALVVYIYRSDRRASSKSQEPPDDDTDQAGT